MTGISRGAADVRGWAYYRSRVRHYAVVFRRSAHFRLAVANASADYCPISPAVRFGGGFTDGPDSGLATVRSSWVTSV